MKKSVIVLAILFSFYAAFDCHSEPINYKTIAQSSEIAKIVTITQNIEFKPSMLSELMLMYHEISDKSLIVEVNEKEIRSSTAEQFKNIAENMQIEKSIFEVNCAERKVKLHSKVYANFEKRMKIGMSFEKENIEVVHDSLFETCNERFAIEDGYLMSGYPRIDKAEAINQDYIFKVDISYPFNPFEHDIMVKTAAEKINDLNFLKALTPVGKELLKKSLSDPKSLIVEFKRLGISYEINCQDGSAHALSNFVLDSKDSPILNEDRRKNSSAYIYRSKELGSQGAWTAYKEVCKKPASIKMAERNLKTRY